jgi:nitrogen fixation NifU-like protein
MSEHDLQKLYTSLIRKHLDHSCGQTHHLSDIQNLKYHANLKNPLCGDKISLGIDLKDNILSSILWYGEGCNICLASNSIMVEFIKNKNIQTIEIIFKNIPLLLKENSTISFKLPESIFAIFSGVKEFPARHKCATLAWNCLDKILKEICT